MADKPKGKNVLGFKKFSDIKNKSKIEEVDPSMQESPDNDAKRPANPNLSSTSKKIERPASRKKLIPTDQNIELPQSDKFGQEEGKEPLRTLQSATNEKVETFGKVAKFPKGTKASKALNFLENVKISKKSIWYLMVEKTDNELQMVKYNYKEGVDLNKFVNELKAYYLNKYSKDKKVCKLIEGIKVDGNDKYSMVKDIPLVTIDGKKIITIITEDLIKLLSK
jgi:hypothetical protein